MLKHRVITALLLLPLVAWLLFGLDVKQFAGALVIVAYIMAWEWAGLAGVQSQVNRSFFALSTAFSIMAVWYFSPAVEFWSSNLWPSFGLIDIHLWVLLAVLITWPIAMLWVIAAGAGAQFNPHSSIKLILGILLITGFWVAMVAIRSVGWIANPYLGAYWLLAMLLLIWGVDVGGYIFGKWLGKHKLIPGVSPGKTWEGCFGGLLLSAAVAFIGSQWIEQSINYLLMFGLVIALAAVSIFGDLFESLLKRQADLKDSSQILPGHGGILDRLDSTLTVAPLFIVLLHFLQLN